MVIFRLELYGEFSGIDDSLKLGEVAIWTARVLVIHSFYVYV